MQKKIKKGVDRCKTPCYSVPVTKTETNMAPSQRAPHKRIVCISLEKVILARLDEVAATLGMNRTDALKLAISELIRSKTKED